MTRARNTSSRAAASASNAKGVEKQFSFTQFGDPYHDTPSKQGYGGAALDPPTPKSQFKNLRGDDGAMNLGIGEMQHSIVGNYPLSTSLQPYPQESRTRPGRHNNRWPLGVIRQSSSQVARDERQLQMMELRANDNGNPFAPYDGRPSRNLMNERPRGGKLGEGIQRVSLNVGGKRNSGGIRDDESILCPTPPNRECAGFELNPQEMNPAVRFYQPINFTVNVNNAGPQTMIHPYFGEFDNKEIEQYNQMMMNRLEQLPNPQHANNAQSLLPAKRRSSQRRDAGKTQLEEDGPYIDPEGTGNFNDDQSIDGRNQQGGKAQPQKGDSMLKKREVKIVEKAKAQATKQASSAKKNVQFNK